MFLTWRVCVQYTFCFRDFTTSGVCDLKYKENTCIVVYIKKWSDRLVDENACRDQNCQKLFRCFIFGCQWSQISLCAKLFDDEERKISKFKALWKHYWNFIAIALEILLFWRHMPLLWTIQNYCFSEQSLFKSSSSISTKLVPFFRLLTRFQMTHCNQLRILLLSVPIDFKYPQKISC